MNLELLQQLSGDMDVVADMLAAIEGVTEKQIQRVGDGFGKIGPNDKAIGTIHNVTTRRIYTAFHIHSIKALEFGLEGRKAEDDIAEKELHAKMHRAHNIAELLKDLAYAQAESDAKYNPCEDDTTSFGLREGWMLVAFKENTNPLEGLFKRLRNGIAIELPPGFNPFNPPKSDDNS